MRKERNKQENKKRRTLGVSHLDTQQPNHAWSWSESKIYRSKRKVKTERQKLDTLRKARNNPS